MNSIQRPHLFGVLAGLFLACGLLFSAMTATTAWLKIKNTQYISVKGSARKNVKSDLAIWRGVFTANAATPLEAQQRIKTDREKVQQFLIERSMTNFSFAPINIDEVKGTLQANGLTVEQIVGYRLTQAVRVESPEVECISQIGSESVALVEQGVLFTTQAPDFIYTKSAEAKLEMLAEATKDARARAEQIAAQGGRTVENLHDADMGVIQITALYNGQTSWEGMNDTSSPDKTITAVITASFALK